MCLSSVEASYTHIESQEMGVHPWAYWAKAPARLLLVGVSYCHATAEYAAFIPGLQCGAELAFEVLTEGRSHGWAWLISSAFDA